MKNSNLLIFTTCYNEHDNIGPLIDQIVEQLPHADILVVDDNSPDRTWDVILDKTKAYKQLTAIQRPRKLGIGSAHKYAIFYALREGYETLITMDADFSHDPKHLPELLAAHAENNFVTGSRYCEGGTSDYKGYRNFVSRLGNIAARIALNVKLKELTTFYRVFDVRSLRHLPLRYINADGYSYGVQIIYYLRKSGVELREVPIHFVDRTRGKSKIPRIQILLSAFDLLKLAAKRLKFARDLSPDVFVDDVCINCGDRVLAMQNRDDPPGSKSYKCLRCNTEQVPASTRQVK
jgi:dolichol-phosphate mannosyltransferase